MSGSMPPEIVRKIEELTRERVKGFSFAGGGCINNGGRLATDKGQYFLKWNDANLYPRMFEAEAKGLDLLRKAECIRVPLPVSHGQAGAHQFLLLEYVEQANKSSGYWEDFGAKLAALHRESGETFGLDHDNYIGSLPQNNNPEQSWTEFFVAHRLRPQVDMAYKENKVDADVCRKFEAFFERLPTMLPTERASLVHGDLWSGNLLADEAGQPCLIDPAVYYGNREVDLAMTQLFGGFEPTFIQAYNSVFPLLPGYSARFDIYNLYPLLVHLNLFGSSYQPRVVSILRQYV
jgi:fructosamine-3-kinase